MADKKCPKCDAIIEEGTKICPECGESIELCDTNEEIISDTVIEDVTSDDALVSETAEETAEDADMPDEAAEDTEDTPKGSKLKLICISLAAVLVIVLGVFGAMRIFGGEINVMGFGIEDVNGRYTDDVYGMYLDFKPGSVDVDVLIPEEDDGPAPEESAAASDAQADSAAEAKEPEYEKKTFDGTLETGYTKEYINSEIIRAYVSENDLGEEYEAYLAEKKTLKDDYQGFAKIKALTKEELDAVDEQYQLTSQGEGLKSTGYWTYDADKKEITLYDPDGHPA